MILCYDGYMMVTGLISIVGASTGQITGGVVARVLGLKIKGLLRMCMLMCVICIIFQGTLISLYCQGPKIAGVDTRYINMSVKYMII